MASDPSTPPNRRGAKADGGSDGGDASEKNAAAAAPPRRSSWSSVAEAAGCDPTDVADFDLQLCDVQLSTIGGAKNEYIFSGRLDNLASCYASLAALIGATDDETVCPRRRDRDPDARALRPRGGRQRLRARSRFVDDRGRHATRVSRARRRRRRGRRAKRSRRKSFIVSADMAHAVHPNYADKHEPGHRPRVGDGVVIKHNANQRYATDAVTAWLFRELGERAGVPVQEFVVRSDLGCGSTIGPILSTRTGIRTVDVGVAQLSMHSVREMCGCDDVKHSVAHFTAVYEGFTKLDETLAGWTPSETCAARATDEY